MNRIAFELDATLKTLDPRRADELTRKVREAIVAAEANDTPYLNPNIDPMLGVENGYPVGYFSSTAGSLADEPLGRGEQGQAEVRDGWE